MSTLSEIVAQLKVNYPKLQSKPIELPLYQLSNDEYNLVVQALEQIANGSVTIDSELDSDSTNPLQNKVIATLINNINNKAMTLQVAPFAGIEESGDAKAQSSSAVSSVTDVYFFEDDGKFGYVTDTELSPFEYYPNWGNRLIYEDDNLEPYTDKLYLDVSTQKLYVYSNGGLVEVNKMTIDGALSSTSTNPIQNKAIYNIIIEMQKMVMQTAGFLELYTVQNDYPDYVTVEVDSDNWITITALRDCHELINEGHVGLYYGRALSEGSKITISCISEGLSGTLLYLKNSSTYPEHNGTWSFPFLPTNDGTTQNDFEHTVGSGVNGEWYLVPIWRLDSAGDWLKIKVKLEDSESDLFKLKNRVTTLESKIEKHYLWNVINNYSEYVSSTLNKDTNEITFVGLQSTEELTITDVIAISLDGLVPDYNEDGKTLKLVGVIDNTNNYTNVRFIVSSRSDRSSGSSVTGIETVTAEDSATITIDLMSEEIVDNEEPYNYILFPVNKISSAGEKIVVKFYFEGVGIVDKFANIQRDRIATLESQATELRTYLGL